MPRVARLVRHARRALGVVLRGAGALVLGVLMLVTSVLVHLDTPVVRRIAVARVNQLVFKPLFQGELVITSLGHVDPFGVTGAAIRISDPTGRPVIVAEGVDGRFATFALLRSVFTHPDDLVIDIPRATIRDAYVRLDMDETGVAIANTFLPRVRSTSPPLPPGHGPSVYAPHIHIDHAWVHGLMPGVPYLDGDVTGLDAAFALHPEELSVDAKKGEVTARGIVFGADATGSFRGSYGMTLAASPVLWGRAIWDGVVGTMREHAQAEIAKGRFDATLDVPEANADAIRSLWPASTITGVANAHLEAHGPLTAIAFALRAGVDSAAVDVSGQLAWGDDKRADLHVDATDIDLRQFVPALAATRLGLHGELGVHQGVSGDLDGSADLAFSGGRVAALPLPPATLKTKGFRAASGAFGGDATLVLDQPGAPTTITAHAVPRGRSSLVELGLTSNAVRLHALRHLEVDATGSASVVGRGTIDLENLAIDASLRTRGDAFERGPLRVGTATVDAAAHGKLFDPSGDVELHARDVRWGTTSFTTVDLSAHGRALRPHVSVHERSIDLPDLDADLDLDLEGGPSLASVDARLAHRGESARARVARARFGQGNVLVDGIVLDGLGATATGSYERRGGTHRIAVHAPRLEVLRIARLANVDEIVRRGTVGVDAELTVADSRIDGHTHLDIDGAAFGALDGISARVEGQFTGRRFVGTASAWAGDVGFLELDARELQVGGTRPLSRSSWQTAFGDIDLKGRIDLAKLAPYVAHEDMPFSSVSGELDLDARVERDSTNDFTPLLQLRVATSGLSVSAPVAAAPAGETAEAAPTPAWTFEGIDEDTTVKINGQTGFLEVKAHLRDSHGDLAVIEASSGAIPYAALFDSPAGALGLLPRLPFDGHVTIPPRDLLSLPPSLGHVPTDGLLQADVTVKGPLTLPKVAVKAKLAKVTASVTRLTTPIDLDITSTYDGVKADAQVHAVRGAHEVLAAEVHGVVQAADLLARSHELAWELSGKAHVDDLPLVTFGPLDDRQVRGRISGDFTLDRLHADAKAEASFSVNDLRVGGAAYTRTTASFVADGATIRGEARVRQADGYGVVKASVPATWGAALWPKPDPKHTLDLSLDTKRFRAAVLLPFMQGSVDELDGLIDADVKATVDPTTRKVALQGSLALSQGVFELGAFGGELHDISAKVVVRPGGLLTLESFKASGVSGELLAAASARLDGLRLQAASATVQIPKSRPLPLTINGSPLGSVDGRLNVTEAMSADGKSLEFKADIPTLHLVVPEKGSQDVQVLGKLQGVTLGRHVGEGQAFAPYPRDHDEDESSATHRAADALVVRVKTHLGDDVTIRRGGDVRIQLSEGPTVTVGETVNVSGRIGLRGGNLNLYGKSFDIETGTVTFVGDDPSNPQVNVTAGWNAPDGSQVKADFVGPLKTGKVTLRSEPPLSQNDIVQLLLFGSADEQTASAQGTPGASSAEGVAGTIATQPLNRALDQFGLSAVSAKVDTSSQNAKPEIQIQIAKDLSLQIAQVIGLPPPGASPDKTFLTIDWRFLRKWSLEATVGDAETTIVDLIWQYRY